VAEPETGEAQEERYSAGFIGSDAIFNLDGLLTFVSQVLPEIKRKYSDFRFVVAGGVSDAFRLAVPDHDDVGVTVMGRLARVSEFYNSVSTVVVPLLNGTGVSLKTIEAASYGIPVLATPIGVRGIPSHELPTNVVVKPLDEFSEAIQHLPLTPAASQSNTDYAQQYLAIFNQTVAAGTNR
jgi:glycosyltransferase involved in cell wall biosynthesis